MSWGSLDGPTKRAACPHFLPLIAARCCTAIGDAPGQLRAGGLGERYLEVMTRRLITLAYPVLTAANKAAIDSFRAEHDAHYVGVVEAHFTMVFEAEGLDEHDYLNHVGTIAATASPINFHCRYAMLGADDGEDTAYVFLIPDEGNSAISLLHDRLYTGVLISKMRLDLKYIPHITIGRCSDRLDAKALCDSLNMQGVSIAGRIDELTVAAVDRDKVEKLRSFKLGAGS
jgi:2'-5' RNA ligase